MRNKSVYRGVLIVAGLLAAAIIVLSHTVSLNNVISQKATTEKPDEKPETKTVIQTPAEALVQGTAVQIDKQVPESLIETIPSSEDSNKFIPPAERIVSNFLSVLFERVIAPNAP